MKRFDGHLKEIQKMLDAGKKIKDIADFLEVSDSAISSYIRHKINRGELKKENAYEQSLKKREQLRNILKK